MMQCVDKTLGQALYDRRQELGHTQEQASVLITGTSQQNNVARWEGGVVPAQDEDLYKRLAAYLDVDFPTVAVLMFNSLAEQVAAKRPGRRGKR